MNSAIPSSCMDRYISRYIVPPHSVQQHQQQLLNQQQANQNLPPNGYYPHQILHQQQQQQQHQQHVAQQQSQSHGSANGFMVGCYNNASGWTGVPLISTASRRPRKFQPINQNVPTNHYQPSKADFDESAMSRLALHAHGAPLILSNNRYRTGKSNPNKPIKVLPNPTSRDDHTKIVQNSSHYTVTNPNPDSHSFTSNDDFGSGHSGNTNSSTSSAASDTCLPRIIKPRKRRKKDRKPIIQNASTSVVTPSTTPTSITKNNSTNQLLPSSSLMLDETTRDFLHEIALIANAGGNYDFSGVPLMHQLPSQLQQQQQQQQQQHQLSQPQTMQHFSSNNSDSSDSGINNLSCSCRLCDPFGKIWAFPLRRSCSDNSAEIELNRAKDVGVIGSNRSNSFRSEWRSSPHSLDQQQQHQQQQQQDFGSGSSRKGSFSDSGDSGCDLLSGLTFCSEDILSSVNRELFLTPVDGGKEFKFPTTGGGGGGGGVGVSVTSISGSGSPGSVNSVGAVSDNSELLLISELTKKLNEGLDLGGRTSASGGGSDSGSAFSDGVFGGSSGGCASGGTDGSSPVVIGGNSADLFVNFDVISRNNLFSANNISKLSNLLFDDGLTAPGLVINSAQSAHGFNNNVLVGNGNSAGVNYIRSNSIQNLQSPQPPPSSAGSSSSSSSSSSSMSSSTVSAGMASQTPGGSSLFSDHQSFLFVPDADRGCEVLSCFDMVWSNDRKLLPVEE
ncbi:alpha-protein kinase 1 [Topomyia yanbarensis]|uniref:alpha-protein kinase 1 n=1 Tax=Topomyia yanbarensis TaxID=2498891 RepID=UPI00273BF1E2|nr:alpha-protein kinase 1 [Topomyia yanbarensis]